MRKSSRGFSLIELLIVVAIILIIAAIAIPDLLKSRQAANQASAVGSLRTINTSEVTYASTYTTGFSSTLLQLDVEPMRRALYGANPHLVALACRAAGIDRAAFLTVFQLSRRQRKCGTALSESDQKEIQAIFSQVPKGDALQRLRGQAA